jgi:hypothetical protein
MRDDIIRPYHLPHWVHWPDLDDWFGFFWLGYLMLMIAVAIFGLVWAFRRVDKGLPALPLNAKERLQRLLSKLRKSEGRDLV